MIMEAVAVKVLKEDEDLRKEAEARDWKKDSGGMDNLRELAGG